MTRPYAAGTCWSQQWHLQRGCPEVWAEVLGPGPLVRLGNTELRCRVGEMPLAGKRSCGLVLCRSCQLQCLHKEYYKVALQQEREACIPPTHVGQGFVRWRLPRWRRKTAHVAIETSVRGMGCLCWRVGKIWHHAMGELRKVLQPSQGLILTDFLCFHTLQCANMPLLCGYFFCLFVCFPLFFDLFTCVFYLFGFS